MVNSIVYERLEKYSPQTIEEERDALKEIMQEIILNGLSDANFFNDAVFQGGTALRIFYNLERFSEDLDFILREPNPNFKWQPYLKAIEDVCKQYGIYPEVIDKSKAGNAVQKMFLKDNSIGKILNLSFQHQPEKKLTIKLEIDTNPPLGSKSETKFLDFPLLFPIELQDLSSNFSGKSHALLCRQYLKGRDWYDFLWYVSKEIIPNFDFLSNAINQTGPWMGKNIQVNPEWYIKTLETKIKEINWPQAKNDVSPFLKEREKKVLSYWDAPFFLDRLSKLEQTLRKISLVEI